MTNRNRADHIRKGFSVTLLSTLATLVVIAGCAQQNSFSEAEYEVPNSAPVDAPAEILGSGSDGDYGYNDSGAYGGLEEIVVFAQKAKRAVNIMSPEEDVVEEPVKRLAALSYDEELWVITRDEAGTLPSGDEVGTGSMIARIPGENVAIPMPLQHTAVEAHIETYLSTVDVRQEFSNPFSEKIEAVYLFPLPEKAAVSEFVMQIGERKIRGILRDKEEAKRIYEQARRQGYRASLLVQKRPNVFEQKVANIEPGKSIDIKIRYFHTLTYRDGWYSFVFPTVVGPRYNPVGTPDPIEATTRDDNRPRTNGTAVRYLAPDERTAHDISIKVNIDAGVSIEELKASHEISTEQSGEGQASVILAAGSTMPNRDFILDFRVAGDELKARLITHRELDSDEGYFTLMLVPPASEKRLDRQPMEMVFVVDTSGSMDGTPLRQVKSAINASLDRLRPADTFQIIRFSNNASGFAPQPVSATRANIHAARQYVSDLEASGGTEMINGIRASLNFPQDPERMRLVTFMTDGYIGNEAQILTEISQRIGESRIFSFGVGDSVNRYLMERMAKIGRGAVAYLTTQDKAGRIMGQYFDRISQPALTDIEINWGSLAATDVYPARVPDLFVGRPVVITGKYVGAESDIVVNGRSAGRVASMTVRHDPGATENPQLPKLWARLKIADLKDQMASSNVADLRFADQIKATALAHQLVSDYTSFVAVDASERTDGEYGVTVNQAVPVPNGVRYETTVKDSN